MKGELYTCIIMRMGLAWGLWALITYTTVYSVNSLVQLRISMAQLLYHYIKIIVVHLSVTGGQQKQKLTSRHKMLDLWLLSFRNQKQAVSVSASLGTNYRCKH